MLVEIPIEKINLVATDTGLESTFEALSGERKASALAGVTTPRMARTNILQL